jgi:signal transduction histidine kinase
LKKCQALKDKFLYYRYVYLVVAIVCTVTGKLCQAQAIQFTSFKATNEFTDSTYNLNKPISLDYKETHIIVGFFDPKDSTNARYAYRLLDFDSRWHENGKLTSVNYINLFGGDYELQVKNLNFPDKIASLKFHLDEAFWQRPWFIPMIAAYGLLVVGMVLYFIRMYRLRNQIRLQQIRNEIAADLHDDVGTALSSITFLGEMAKSRFEKKPDDIRPILERIMNESREMMQTMRGMVWVINPQNDKANDFFDKVKSFAEAVLSSKKIAVTFRVRNVASQQIGLEVQRNLFLIFKEAVVNVAKHSGASEVLIAIEPEKDYIWIQIKDNGKGFDCNAITDGNGLRNLKNRAVQIGGKLDVQSKAGEGTQINMVVPIA